jgi:peptidoglycan/xylan/chitin deacetylase (PgdA/CDA1 family)
MISPLAASWLYTGAGTAAGLGLVWGGCAYAALWPGSQIFGRTLTAPPRPGEIALTFDDGPNPAWTPRLLEILDGRQVRATFFLVGRHAAAQPGMVRQIVAAGHLIGNHSWSHPNLALTAPRKVLDELSKTSKRLEQIAGVPVRFFRPPYGARRPGVLRAARSMGMIPVLWNAMTNDWEERSSEAIVGKLAAAVDRNDRQGRATNIVLHDGSHRALGADRGPSVAAADALTARYKATHKFVTLDAWDE